MAGPDKVCLVILLKMVNALKVLTSFINLVSQWSLAFHSNKSCWFLKELISKHLCLRWVTSTHVWQDLFLSSWNESHLEIQDLLIGKANAFSLKFLVLQLRVVMNGFADPWNLFLISRFHFVSFLLRQFLQLFAYIYRVKACNLIFMNKSPWFLSVFLRDFLKVKMTNDFKSILVL